MKQNSKLIALTGAFLIIVSPLLPFIKMLGQSFNGFHLPGSGAAAGVTLMVLGGISAIMTIIGKRWNYIVAIIMGLVDAGLGINYFLDARDLGEIGGSRGIGIYAMIFGGFILILGCVLSIMNLRLKKYRN